MAHESGAVSKDEKPVVTPTVEADQPDKILPRSAPDGGWSWMCVLGASIMFVIFGATIRGFGVVYLALLAQYNESATAINVALTGFLGEYGGKYNQCPEYKSIYGQQDLPVYHVMHLSSKNLLNNVDISVKSG